MGVLQQGQPDHGGHRRTAVGDGRRQSVTVPGARHPGDRTGQERYWKLTSHAYVHLFNGTPFKTMIWRWRGARIGRHVFDDGCVISERGLTSIGYGSTLNAGCIIQCRSQEDGAFKSDRVALGAGVTIGVGALVHYGTTVGDQAQLAAHSFLMKGEEIPPAARWEGNPAGGADAISRR